MTTPSRDRVEAVLRSLRGRHRSFDVHQTSVALAPSAYDTALGDGLVDAAIRVENAADEVLAVEGDGTEPRVRVDHPEGTDLVERIRSALVDATGVVCRITDLRAVSMLTIHDETDTERPPKFALDVRLAGRYERGDPGEGLAWQDGIEERAPV